MRGRESLQTLQLSMEIGVCVCVHMPICERSLSFVLSDHLCMTPSILFLKLCPDRVHLPEADPAAVPTPHH